jgi:phage shock protein A
MHAALSASLLMSKFRPYITALVAPAALQVMASEKQMATKFQAAQNTSDEWLRRAELAVRKGQDELAREALLRRKTFDTAAASLKVC